jgi:hypothetical protein
MPQKVDLWRHRSSSMLCGSCMFFLNYRCRRRAPTLDGWPAVFPDDWCGDHKLCKETMVNMPSERERNAEPKD